MILIIIKFHKRKHISDFDAELLILSMHVFEYNIGNIIIAISLSVVF